MRARVLGEDVVVLGQAGSHVHVQRLDLADVLAELGIVAEERDHLLLRDVQAEKHDTHTAAAARQQEHAATEQQTSHVRLIGQCADPACACRRP